MYLPPKGAKVWYITPANFVDWFTVDHTEPSSIRGDEHLVVATKRLRRAGKKSIKTLPLHSCFATVQEALDHWRDSELKRISDHFELMYKRYVGSPNNSTQV